MQKNKKILTIEIQMLSLLALLQTTSQLWENGFSRTEASAGSTSCGKKLQKCWNKNQPVAMPSNSESTLMGRRRSAGIEG